MRINTRLLTCLLLCLVLCNHVLAEDRPLPYNGTVGTLSISALPTIVIDGQTHKLTAGAQIRNEKNLIVQTATLKGADVKVLFKVNKLNQIDRLWILTQEEVKQFESGTRPKPIYPTKS